MKEERHRLELKLDPWTGKKLDTIMASGLFLTKSEAIKAMIIEFATRVECGEFSDKGRKL